MLNINPLIPDIDELGRRLRMNPQAVPNNQPIPSTPVPQQASLINQIPPQVAQAQPDFSRIPIQPAPAMPAEAAIDKLQAPQPNDPEFQNSKLRTIFNAIAGGFAGAAGHPEIGRQLHDAKYDRAMAGYTNKLNLLKTKRESEKEQVARSEKEVEEGVKRGGAQSLSVYREGQLDVAGKKVNITANEQKSKADMRSFIQKYDEWKMKNPKLDDLQFLYSLPEDEQAEALKLHKKMQDDKQKDLKRLEDEARVKTTGTLEAQDTPLGQRVAGTIAGSRTTATEAAKAAAPLSTDESLAVENAIARAKANPDTVNEIIKTLSKKGQQHFNATYDGPFPRKLNTEEQKIATTAKTAIGHATNLLSYIKDPDIQASIGPWRGRIAQLEQAIGGSFGKSGNQENNIAEKVNSLDLGKGINPNDPKEMKMAKFLDLLKYLVLFEASATSGTRPSWQLVRELKETQGVKFNLPRMIGNLEAAAESANIRINALYAPSAYGQPVKDEKPAGKYKYEVIK